MKWFYDLKIGTKLTASFVIISLIAGAIGYIGIKNLNDMSAKSEEMYGNMTVPITQLSNITEAFQRIRINSRDMLMAADRDEMTGYINRINDLSGETSSNCALLEKTLLSQEAKDLFKALTDSRAAYRSDLDKMIELAKAGKKAEALAILRGDGFKSAMAEQSAIDKLKEKKLSDAEGRNEANLADAKTASTFMLGSLAIGMLLAITLGLFIARITSAPIRDVVRSIDDADLNMNFNSDRKDEVGDLQRAFDRFVGSIKETLLKVAEAAAAVASASAEISSSTEQMAAGSQEQTSQASEVASAVEEMTKTIVENSRGAASTTDHARKAKAAAEEGVNISRSALDAIRRNVEIAGAVGTIVNSLGSSSEKIGDIITVIDDIADQTNLLALNAAIEAARAGDQGRGFAVVADEVRKLAERTTKATKEIAELIKGIQGLTTQGVSAMQKAGGIVDENRKMTEQTAEALNGIVEMSTRVTDMIAQIAAASEQQSSASEQISKNVDAISTVTGQTAAGTQQIAKAAEDLNRLTENLQQYIEKFKLSEAGSAASKPMAAKAKVKKAQEKSHIAVRENGVLVPHE
ncbi:MAG TPA: methyl-accepting chemotaxis protein [Bacteroidota bacterium]|nr:methyl-accepting chemotaxis protein [Bacteroidota bacterium]